MKANDITGISDLIVFFTIHREFEESAEAL
jgi:hypothetical protein